MVSRFLIRDLREASLLLDLGLTGDKCLLSRYCFNSVEGRITGEVKDEMKKERNKAKKVI